MKNGEYRENTDPREVFDRVRQHLIELSAALIIYRDIFRQNKETIDLLNDVAPATFHFIQRAYIESLVVATTRLHECERRWDDSQTAYDATTLPGGSGKTLIDRLRGGTWCKGLRIALLRSHGKPAKVSLNHQTSELRYEIIDEPGH